MCVIGVEHVGDWSGEVVWEWAFLKFHSHTTTPYPPLPHHDFHSISRAPLHPLPTLTPHSGLGIAHSTGTDKLCHSISHYFIHTKVKRGADTAWCHSKLGPHSTSLSAGEGEDERGCLSRDDDAAGGALEARRLEIGRTPKARHAWPYLGITSRDRRESEAPARSAPQARDPLAKQWRGFQHPLDQDPWNALISTCSIFRIVKGAAIRSLSSLRKMPSGFWRQMGVDPPLSGTPSLITRDRIVQRTTRSPDA